MDKISPRWKDRKSSPAWRNQVLQFWHTYVSKCTLTQTVCSHQGIGLSRLLDMRAHIHVCTSEYCSVWALFFFFFNKGQTSTHFRTAWRNVIAQVMLLSCMQLWGTEKVPYTKLKTNNLECLHPIPGSPLYYQRLSWESGCIWTNAKNHLHFPPFEDCHSWLNLAENCSR